ncbi:MAG: DUF559 domain-containing protein [Candidatus Pristimantibacillus sp.]
MQDSLARFIEEFHRDAALNGKYRNKIGKIELLFLELVWGAAFHFNFDGLKVEHPFLDFKGGQRFADFVYVKNGIRLVIEIDGFTTHARDLSPGEFNDHLLRQNDLVLSGWMVLRFSAWQVEHQPRQCEKQIKQAIGHIWSQAYSVASGNLVQMWDARKQSVIQMALRRDGKIKPSEVAHQFNITSRSALNWLRRFQQEGAFEPIPSAQRVTVYRLPNYVQ